MRIRCSKGLRISAFFGHFFIRSTDLLALPACDVDKVGCGEGRRADFVPWCSGRPPRGQPGVDDTSANLWGPTRRLAIFLFDATWMHSAPPALQSFSVEITHEETLLTGQVAYLQASRQPEQGCEGARALGHATSRVLRGSGGPAREQPWPASALQVPHK